MMTEEAILRATASEIANQLDADVILYNASITREIASHFIDMCAQEKSRENAIFFLCTTGGDPDAAYRIARCLQKKYKKVSIFICGYCKSAGTLIAVGAHEVVMSDHGELGPLDMQVKKIDELLETDSGLTVLTALSTLEKQCLESFEKCFINLKIRSNSQITLKTAADLASKLATGLISPIVAQIDPMHIGEVSRAINIGHEYGRRLSEVSKNIKTDALERLVKNYPSHGFVIDKTEAETLFENIREPTSDEHELIKNLNSVVRYPANDPLVMYLSFAKNKDSSMELGYNNQEVIEEVR